MRGMKELGVSVPANHFEKAEELKGDVVMNDENEQPQHQNIKSKDLVKFSLDSSSYIDFRLQRTLTDRIKEKQVKSYKDAKVLSSLIRMLIFESTRLTSNPGQTEDLVRYDTYMH